MNTKSHSSAGQREEASEVRSRAFRRMIWAAIIAVLFLGLIIWMSYDGWQFHGPGIGLPLLPFLYFSAEFITGVPFSKLSENWDRLKGWQRGVLGTFIVLIGGSLFVIGFAMLTSYFATH